MTEVAPTSPFSGVPTQHVVESDGVAYHANCAWDALAIPPLLGLDAEIESEWDDTGEPAHLSVADGDLVDDRGTVRFAVPAARWWDDIVET